MSKKAKQATELTPDELAVLLANTIVRSKAQIKQLEEQIAKDEEQLRTYVSVHGKKTIGPLEAYERANAPTLSGASGKTLDVLKEQLCNELDSTYWSKKLELGKMMAALDADVNLKAHLKAKGLTIEQKTSTYFREVKGEAAPTQS